MGFSAGFLVAQVIYSRRSKYFQKKLLKMASRTLLTRANAITRRSLFSSINRIPAATVNRCMSKVSTETDAEFDGWEVRKAMNDLSGMDLVPEPKIISAALRACRRINDYSLAVRFLEAVKFKCGGKMEIYNYVINEVKPTLTELGIETPEELGYDKPELALKTIYEV